METNDILAEAIRHFSDHGYESPDVLAYWMQAIRASILSQDAKKKPPTQMAYASLDAVFQKAIRGAAKYHKGIDKFTLANVSPRLRPLLTARIMASADLIKLNREQALEVTLRRFSGWATSQPPGGSPTDFREVKKHIGKRLQSSTFEERRMLIDQGHKLISAVNQTIAEGNGAIAAQWHHVHQANYDARPAHEARDDKVFLIRDSWAHQDGLVKFGANGYTDQIEAAAELPFCRCYYTYIYSLSRIPADLLTEKGKKVMEQTRLRVA